MSHEMHVVLVGLPGVGKSSVGRDVARRLRRRFIDFDTAIERAFGKKVSQIFADDGEAAFRDREAELSRFWAAQDAAVLAPGGGWVANLAARGHLQGGGRIIYLRVAPDEAVRRMGRGIVRRPLLAGGSTHQIMRSLYDARRSEYERCADMTVETSGVRRSEVVARVIGLVLAAERDFAETSPTATQSESTEGTERS